MMSRLLENSCLRLGSKWAPGCLSRKVQHSELLWCPGFFSSTCVFMKVPQSLAGKSWAPGYPSLEVAGAFKTFTSLFCRLYWSHLTLVFVALAGCLACSVTSAPCSLFYQWACNEEIRLWWWLGPHVWKWKKLTALQWKLSWRGLWSYRIICFGVILKVSKSIQRQKC